MQVRRSACGCLSTCPQPPPEIQINYHFIDYIDLHMLTNIIIYIYIYLCKWAGHWSAYESGCPLVARGRLHALPCIIDNVHIAQDVLFACLLLELQCTSQVHALPCTIDNVHNMYYTLLGCCACCFLNCNVHYRKSDRPSDWPARSVQLFAQQTDCNKQSDARWGSVLSVKRIGHHAYQPKQDRNLSDDALV